MSSPPPTNPLKRPSISSVTSQPLSHKRARMHPLRQTSFPTTSDDPRSFAATSDAGSVTGSFTGSVGGASADGVFAGASGKGNKKRGRKSKAEKEREREDAMSASARGGERTGSVDAEGSVRGQPGERGGGAAGGGGGGDEAEEDDDDDEGELLGREEGATDTEAEKKNLALLVDAFTSQQSERYDLFKRAKLRKETLRRIVNHALSQSVPASVVTTINGFTKVFAGEMIEKARTVQAEWADAHDQSALAAFEAEQEEKAKKTGDASRVKQEEKEEAGHDESGPGSTPAQFKAPPNPHRGQLLPSHLREALRRYKRDGEGGGVGFSGLSMGNLGVRGSVTWAAGGVGGRRIFR